MIKITDKTKENIDVSKIKVPFFTKCGDNIFLYYALENGTIACLDFESGIDNGIFFKSIAEAINTMTSYGEVLVDAEVIITKK